MTASDPYEGIITDIGKAKANGHAGGEEQKAADFEPIDFVSLEGQEPPPREWTIEHWIPSGTVTSLYGAGGIGKTMIGQQMATCKATGIAAFGFRVGKPAPVVGVFTEDDNSELWRRQVRINDAIGLSMQDLRKLHLQGRAGLENTLVTYPSNQKPRFHPLVNVINAACPRYRPGLVILDNIAQLFGGDENDRHQVSHFCNILVGLAVEFACGVLLLGHPSKADGSEYSGSTAWNNAVRSRLLLCRDKTGELRLMRPKANYAESDTLPLAWINGVLRPVSGESLGPVEDELRRQRERHIESVFLKALDRLTELKVVVTHKVHATAYAPKMMARYDLTEGIDPKLLQEAMLRLIDRGEVLTDYPVNKKADRKWSLGMVRASSVSEDPEYEAPDAAAAENEALKEDGPDA